MPNTTSKRLCQKKDVTAPKPDASTKVNHFSIYAYHLETHGLYNAFDIGWQSHLLFKIGRPWTGSRRKTCIDIDNICKL